MSVLSVWDDAKSRFVPQEVSITPPTSSFASRVAASALAVAKPVYTTSTGKVALCNATELAHTWVRELVGVLCRPQES